MLYTKLKSGIPKKYAETIPNIPNKNITKDIIEPKISGIIKNNMITVVPLQQRPLLEIPCPAFRNLVKDMIIDGYVA